MTSIEYELLRRREPGLNLPSWRELTNTCRHKAKRLSARELYGRRMAKLVTRKMSAELKVDRLRKIKLPDWRVTPF